MSNIGEILNDIQKKIIYLTEPSDELTKEQAEKNTDILIDFLIRLYSQLVISQFFITPHINKKQFVEDLNKKVAAQMHNDLAEMSDIYFLTATVKSMFDELNNEEK